jgi:hypothetical protein
MIVKEDMEAALRKMGMVRVSTDIVGEARWFGYGQMWETYIDRVRYFILSKPNDRDVEMFYSEFSLSNDGNLMRDGLAY